MGSGQQRYTDKPILHSNQQNAPNIGTVATQPQPEVAKQPLLHKNSTTSLLTNGSVKGRGSISSTITEDPVQTIDISMAHTLLTYMESITADKLNKIWQHHVTCIVLLTPLSENSSEKCALYWPDESTRTFGCYEVHLISEHILSEDYVVRSLFVRNVGTGHSRTITQFHYLSWPSDDIPSSAD